jgi:hypothetical protein
VTIDRGPESLFWRESSIWIRFGNSSGLSQAAVESATTDFGELNWKKKE